MLERLVFIFLRCTRPLFQLCNWSVAFINHSDTAIDLLTLDVYIACLDRRFVLKAERGMCHTKLGSVDDILFVCHVKGTYISGSVKTFIHWLRSFIAWCHSPRVEHDSLCKADICRDLLVQIKFSPDSGGHLWFSYATYCIIGLLNSSLVIRC